MRSEMPDGARSLYYQYAGECDICGAAIDPEIGYPGGWHEGWTLGNEEEGYKPFTWYLLCSRCECRSPEEKAAAREARIA